MFSELFSVYKTVFNIRAARKINAIIYFLTRLPLIGKHIPDKIYAIGTVKTIVAALIEFFKIVSSFFTKALYLIISTFLIPIIFRDEEFGENMFSGKLPEYFHIFFFLSCAMMFLINSNIMSVTQERYICIKHMRADANKFIFATVPIDYIIYFVTFLPGILLSVLFCGGNILDGFKIFLCLISFRISGEAMHLLVFKKFNISLGTKIAFALSSMFILGAAAYLPMLLERSSPIINIFLSWPALIIELLALIFSVRYIFKGFGDLRPAVIFNLTESAMTKEDSAAKAAFKDVEMKDADLSSTVNYKGVENKKGNAYFNALFFARHKRQIFKPIIIRIAIVAGVTACALIYLFFDRERASKIFLQIPSFLPVFVFIMYVISTGQKATRAMFYNCDISMLRYAFYRNPKVILSNFNIRLRYISLHNLLVAASICLSLIILTVASGSSPLSISMLTFCVTLLMLSVFFSIHYLFLYYVFQPYTTEFGIKNPFFSIINGVIYILCFLSLQLESAGGFWFPITVISFTAVYMVTALILVNKFSQKNFRVK